MAENTKYFVLKEKAVPEVLLKVVEATSFRIWPRNIRTGSSRAGRYQPEFIL